MQYNNASHYDSSGRISSGVFDMMKKGTRVKHTTGWMATIDRVEFFEGTKPTMARLFRDDSPNMACWFCVTNLAEIAEPTDKFTYFLTSSVIKVDLKKQGWTSSARKLYILQSISRREGFNSLTNEDGAGVQMIGYSKIDKKEFDKLKYKLFI